MRDSWNLSTLATPEPDMSPLPPNVWDVWYNNLAICIQNAPSRPQRAFIGKDRYTRMMANVPTKCAANIDIKLRSPYISGILITIDYAERERLDFQ